MKSIHRRFLVPMLPLLILLSGPASAADMRTPGSWSLQFQIAEDFTLARFDDASIAVKRHLSAPTAIRTGLDLALSGMSADTVQPDSTTGRVFDSDATSVGLSVLLLRYRSPEATTTFFWGVGPKARYSTDSRSTENVQTDGTRSLTDDESTLWTVGARGVAGVEASLLDWLAVHAEYGLDFDHRWVDQESSSEGGGIVLTRTEDQTGWSVRGTGVRFGASAYF